MDYDQFFPKQECDCSNHIRVAGALVASLFLLIDCVTSCRRSRKMNDMTTENQTLKNIILQSVDRALMKMMKNGSDLDDSDVE